MNRQPNIADSPPATSSSYLDPQTLAAVGSIELRARMAVEGLMTGMHRSPFHGFSVEFAQHRPYVPGDDTRFLDWKVYARTDKLYLKQYQQETNLDMVLLVDATGSMGYSSRGQGVEGARGRAKAGAASSDHSTPWSLGHAAPWTKFDHAATLAAAMTHLALRQQDRVGLTVFSDSLHTATRLSNSQGHWRSIIESLQQQADTFTKNANATTEARDAADDAALDFAGLFDRVVAKLTQRSLVVLISDLFDDPANLERGLARLHHRRHDVILLQTLDPAERTFPFRDPSDFVGLEHEGRLPLDPAALRSAYLDELNAHLRQVEQLARRFHFDYLLLDTSEPLAAPLSHFLAHRAARIAKA